jgi:hypothetical protein
MPTEYITTLEGNVMECDQLTNAICARLGSTKSENVVLQQEIKTLNKALLSTTEHASSSALLPLSPLPISAPSPTTQSTISLSLLLTPNMHKDLPLTSSHLTAKGLWGSSNTFGGIITVHTVTISDLITCTVIKPTLQGNINS